MSFADRFRLSGPEIAVFVSGVSSMGLEILAGRVVAPQFGSSIYTWGSIIAVFLAALSLGYHVGGQRARTQASNVQLVRLLLGTAAYVALLIFFGDQLLISTTAFPLPSRFASLPAVILMFGPPTYLLGFISPYAAQLSQKEGIGEASGHVYALGTIGSIVGAFGTTFFLIPSLSVTYIYLTLGGVAVLTALYLTWPDDRVSALPAVGVALLLTAATTTGALGFTARGEVVYETQTAYQELEVIDSGDTRTLYLDGQRHSAMDTSNPTRHVFEYTRYFHLPYLFAEDPDDIDRVLFIGGGGFSGPRRFAAEYNATIDVAEIDPEVVRVANEYFQADEYDINVHVQGGRQFLQETDTTYDLIVLDAYRRDKVPFQLTTSEFMNLASDRLSPHGMVVANVISAPSGPASDFYRAEYRTMNGTFEEVYAFPTIEAGVVQNIELVATMNEERITQEQLRERNRARDIGIDLSEAIDGYTTDVPTDDVPVLRDNRAPVDRLLDPMVGQRYIIEEAGPEDGTDETNAENETGTANDPAAVAVRPAGLWSLQATTPTRRVSP
ncbi:spermidine synthase [Haloferax sp. Atlit-48N]|uniref:Fused MFS/spermidine synthase n=1 Tax=Haloferax sp. Atlit-48N TaxID=2077198 RepID=A0ACD5I256_9EURY|nr:fused MFS/spermidine synthase [Haloferax sp. Atlit-48N]RDZ30901.1 spermidine synthase [Haloferax sp. Atlit-48N]